MNEYKNRDEDGEKTIYCNCCGQSIIKNNRVSEYVDYLHVEKIWSYFSSKDLTGHTFNICEGCYDKWVDSFAIPVEELAIEELAIEELRICSEEEMEQLNKAYAQQLAK
ncbi:hypothetical protein [Sporanaerobium hydrogeniformans]|uniref:hypothetical protein n=1 Tax=Sporanaerobium hydrogeniformans TaxID=3072179 RepID=UPI0015D4A635|nr:hypothetical protein [Sporanaerobium hydrogeniformans]